MYTGESEDEMWVRRKKMIEKWKTYEPSNVEPILHADSESGIGTE